MNDNNAPVTDDGYETPQLSEYGSIEEWTKGRMAELVNISLVL